MLAKGFFLKLAAGNLSRNRRMYLPYFISATIIVSVYFMVTTILYMRSIGNLSYTTTVQQMFGFGMLIMTILIFPFMLYINSFLIKRRKKEFGLYAILGLEKRHVARVIFWENLIVSFASLLLGFLTGMVFGRLIFMLLLFSLKAMASGSQFTIPWQAYAYTAALFSLIFLVTTIFNLLHVQLANPIDLLKGGQKGEKKVRFVIPLSLIGFALLGWAYYTSATVTNAVAALNQFILAVIAVIIATFFLFTTGSILLLSLLRKNKGFYYKPNNFVSVSSLFHRMKQNAAGLASICILSTMVLVTVSCCCALFLGQEDTLRARYPDDISINLLPELTASQRIELDLLIDEMEVKHNVKVKDRASYHFLGGMLLLKDKEIRSTEILNLSDINTKGAHIFDAKVIPLESYNAVTGSEETLSENEVLVLSEASNDSLDSFRVGDTEFTVKRIIQGTRFSQGKSTYPLMGIVVKDKAAVLAFWDSLTPDHGRDIRHVLVFDLEGAQEDGLGFAYDMRSRGVLLEGATWVDDIFTNRIEAYAVYGGLLFLGIFFIILFLTATVLIIYFKQVSEGYDDKERFEILQKVGMDDDEVKRTINKQVLIVFFLPLAGALLHLLAASNMIIRMLEAFSLYNKLLTAICLVATSLIFGGVYAIVYRLTAKTYYRIVKR